MFVYVGNGAHFFDVKKYDKREYKGPNAVMVRTRKKEDYDWLMSRIGDNVITEDAGADYRYRVVVAQAYWAHLLWKEAMEMQYTEHYKDRRPTLKFVWALEHSHGDDELEGVRR